MFFTEIRINNRYESATCRSVGRKEIVRIEAIGMFLKGLTRYLVRAQLIDRPNLW